ncbi:UBX domain-containing protein 1-like [Liolophura sinensis]|uniref:UBX domain-containing protein 1-like n=1 Tax=Liolophura sinensis TaxID=3198878 RepID=UPI00315979DC
MSTDVKTLMEMGFPENQAARALAKTNYKGVQAAMDWIFAHADDPDINDPYEVPKGNVLGSSDQSEGATNPESTKDKSAEGTEAGDGQSQQPKSLKCDECGKLLKSDVDAQAHAARTQHTSFSESTEEIKPLTEEEKREQSIRLQEKLKQRRLEKEEQVKKEQIAREKMRRSTGKELVTAKQKMEEDEIKRIAEQRRKEKMEEKIARQKIKDEIEKDKRERAARAKKSSTEATDQAPVATSSPPQKVPAKDYSQCRLQIRLTNGQALTQTFSSKEPLAAVRLYIEMNRTDGSGPFNLMTNFPKKVFSVDDMEKPLSELGLVPSAVIILTKA